MSAPAPSAAPAAEGAFAPLRERVFAALWIATVVGNTGSFMRDVASAWMAAEIAGSPAAVATIQAAATAPAFLLALRACSPTSSTAASFCWACSC